MQANLRHGRQNHDEDGNQPEIAPLAPRTMPLRCPYDAEV